MVLKAKYAKLAAVTVDRLAIETGQAAADRRLLLFARLEERIESVDQICRLTDAQRRKLQLAGRGDIKRLFDRVDALREKFEDLHAPLDEHVVSELGGALKREAETIQRTLKAGVFEQESLFAKALKRTLTPRQSDAFEVARSNSP